LNFVGKKGVDPRKNSKFNIQISQSFDWIPTTTGKMSTANIIFDFSERENNFRTVFIIIIIMSQFCTAGFFGSIGCCEVVFVDGVDQLQPPYIDETMFDENVKIARWTKPQKHFLEHQPLASCESMYLYSMLHQFYDVLSCVYRSAHRFD
jgi:hypothetical protein